MFTSKTSLLTGAVLSAMLATSTANATTIALDYEPSQFADTKGQQALAGFQQAASFWESMFTDSVTVNLTIAFDSLGETTLGGTSSTYSLQSYHDTAYKMIDDATSVGDQIATNNLQCAPQGEPMCGMTFLDTEQDINGNDITEHDADGSNDNFFLDMTQANAKALGFTTDLFGNPFSNSDAYIVFSNTFAFDFDPSDGIDSDKWDFVGVAIHEIGHALGFVSGVDVYDRYNDNDPNSDYAFDLDNYAIAATLDLFRYSEESYQVSAGVKDFRAGGNSYFSIDGGATNLAPMSTGIVTGDGNQASHWKDHLDIGALDPTAAPGEFVDVTGYDLLAFDVIGWDLRTATVPEPSTIALFGLATLGLVASRRRKIK
ncbi:MULTISPECIES: NF038122 family metalloprotease [Thalassotalea]|uniref:NF038122 family metalloprotease n=1 Tax=Thalassotalea castellviae TaxID=3075612 RepID=A0ABU2ZZR2_9GAMM|nr:NF038122 family metalloprotease [Thalassotalea sp. W431]MDT0603414.1 NF038122 family metalloprotease [Thalassotalea sp. W431]